MYSEKMVEIKAELNPFRIIFGKTKSVELMVSVINDSNKIRTMSVDIILSSQLSFEKNGLSNTRTVLLGEVKPNEKMLKYYTIYPKMVSQKGEQPIYISAMEHFENKYDYILSKKTKQLTLRIE